MLSTVPGSNTGIPWVHHIFIAASFISVVTILGMCLCRKWMYRKTGAVSDDEEDFPDFDTKSDVQNKSKYSLETLVDADSNLINVDGYCKLTPMYAQPPLQRLASLRLQPTPLAEGKCDITMENIQPAYDDSIAYERIRSGNITLPKHIPQAPTDLSEDLGVIYFTLSYDVFGQVMKLFIDRADGLPKMDTFGTSDPFVKIFLTPDTKNIKMETRVRRRHLSPVWKEIFTFTDFPHEKLMEKSLFLQVFDYDRFSRDDVIGEVTLPLRDVPMQAEPVEFVKELCPSTHSSGWLGDILLSLCYKPSDSHLTLIVIKCRKLKPMDVTGTSDAYVKVTLMSCGRKIAKKRTSVKMKCLDPVWNEAMVFEVVFSKIRDIQIVVCVRDFNHYLPNKTIGQVVIGARSTGTGFKHWTEVLGSSRKAIAMWHRVVKQTSKSY